jgi:hypothetical protein
MNSISEIPLKHFHVYGWRAIVFSVDQQVELNEQIYGHKYKHSLRVAPGVWSLARLIDLGYVLWFPFWVEHASGEERCLGVLEYYGFPAFRLLIMQPAVAPGMDERYMLRSCSGRAAWCG